MAMTYWIKKQNGQIFKTQYLGYIIKEMEIICLNYTKKPREVYMSQYQDIGMYDDSDCTFYRAMRDIGVQSGVVRKDGALVAADAFSDTYFSKEEYGD